MALEVVSTVVEGKENVSAQGEARVRLAEASFGGVIKGFAKMELVRCSDIFIFTITLNIPQPVKWELTEVVSTY